MNIDAVSRSSTVDESREHAEIKDARIHQQRIHTAASARFYLGYQALENHWGNPDEGCPRIGSKDEIVYLLGLFSGIEALLHDRAGGGRGGELLQPNSFLYLGAIFGSPPAISYFSKLFFRKLMFYFNVCSCVKF